MPFNLESGAFHYYHAASSLNIQGRIFILNLSHGTEDVYASTRIHMHTCTYTHSIFPLYGNSRLNSQEANLTIYTLLSPT